MRMISPIGINIYSAAAKGKGGISMSAGEVAIRAGNTVAWYDSTDTTTLTKDTGATEAVSRWNDKLLSGHDLIQATGASQPIWSTDGILFDGSNDFMTCAAFTYAQPIMVYLVIKQITFNKNYAGFFGNALVAGDVELVQGTVTPRIYTLTNAGAQASNENTNLTLDTWAIVRVLFNTPTGKIVVNNTAPQTGGTWAAGSLARLQIGTSTFGTGYRTNAQWKEAIFRNKVDTSGDETAIYNYLATKHGMATI